VRRTCPPGLKNSTSWSTAPSRMVVGGPRNVIVQKHECDREKDNVGWGETKHDRLARNQPDHKDSCEANGR
jgi:hypothetical protein